MSESLYTITNVEQIYGTRTVLRIPSLTVQPGEILVLLGPSGAGKSTTLRLLALLEAPTRGQVNFHNNGKTVDYATATLAERRQITMIFQRPLLLNRSARANIAYGLKLRGERDANAKIDAMLKRVALTQLAAARPRTLSGGEMQRAAIARALIIEPRVLLLDEPTAHLDPYNIRLIETLTQEQNQQHGATIVWVTHDIFQARRLATRVVLFFDGEIIEVATKDEFFTAPKDPRAVAFLSGELIY